MREFEVLGLNAGYFLGYDGRKQKYLRHPLRSLIGNSEVEKERLGRLVDEVENHDPDVVGLVEIDQGSIRTFTKGQAEHLVQMLEDRGFEYDCFSEFKYRDLSVLEHFPLIAAMSNGVLYKGGEIRDHHLLRGWKRLLIEVEYENLSVFVCHLPYPLFKRTQKRQLKEISEILDGKENFIIYGDFNKKHLEELEILEETDNADIHSPGDTYPLCNPKGPFDIFVTGPGVELKESEILDIEISDHKAVRASFRY